MKMMKTAVFGLVLAGFLLPAVVFAGDAKFKDYIISGPVSHKNLSIFVIRGKDEMNTSGVITLEEALKHEKAVVRETGSVNSLVIENLSKTESIFIQAGDIVKGGRQDRTLKIDILLKPGCKVQIDAFCVEHGRWSKRGGEASDKFESAAKSVASGDMKLAIRKKGDQQEVWNKVGELQKDLSDNAGFEVRSPVSSSSLQLSLENDKLVALTDEYRNAVLGAVRKYNDALGIAVAINGDVVSADIYGSRELFSRVMFKLIDAAATEAVSAGNKKGNEDITPDFVAGWLARPEKAPQKVEKIGDDQKLSVQETDVRIKFETRDADDKPIRQNYLNNK
jgi:hypothetical protein